MSAFDPKRTSAADDLCNANWPLIPIPRVAKPCCNRSGASHSPGALGEAMRRRDFIKAIAVSAVTWPLAARAQQSATPTRRIGVLMETEEGNPERTKQFARFRDRLASLGWVEGHTVNIDYRFAAAHGDQFPTLAKELVALQPDVVLTVSTPATAAVQRESHTIPIVFLGTSDPIGSGFVSSLARPSGNLTGFMLYEDGIAGKWLGMLKQAAASLKRAALVANPKTTAYDYFVRTAEAAAPSFGIEVIPTPISNATDIERSIDSFAQVPNGGLLLPSDGTTIVYRDLVVALANRNRLPAVYALREFVIAGGLMSYSTDIAEQFDQAAIYVDRIMRGAKPSDLPVQTPTKYETTINLNAAKTIALAIPPGLLATADEVIE
jgi:putative tryptophan/tyrosine transport system substrate-binding protein